jgi:hypothetical protein
MRKLVVFLAVIFAVALVGSAYADDTNQAYKQLFDGKNVCKHCQKDKCDTCKPKCDTCKPKCEKPCAPKCDTCKPKCEKPCAPKCDICAPKKCCKVETCKPKCDTCCKPKCNPCKEWEYPNPCRFDDSEMGRNGLSRRGV